MSGSSIPWVLWSLSLQSVAPAEDSIAQCVRSEQADAASDLFAEASDLAYQARTPAAHAAAGAGFAGAARTIPESERTWTQGTKYVEKAHEEYLKAFTDPTAVDSDKSAWLLEDQALLAEYLAQVDQARGRGDPCMGDASAIETHLQLVEALVASTASVPEPDPGAQDPPPDATEPTVGEASEPTEPEPNATSVDDSRPRTGRGLTIGGAVGLAVGVSGLVVMGAGMGLASIASRNLEGSTPSEREAIFKQGRVGNTLSVTGIAVAATGVAVGVALLVAGAVIKKRSGGVRARAFRQQWARSLGGGWSAL